MTNPPGTRTIKVDSLLHQQIMVMAAQMGIDTRTLVEEAVVSHLHTNKEEILRRVQERLDELFATVEERSLSAPQPIPEEVWHGD